MKKLFLVFCSITILLASQTKAVAQHTKGDFNLNAGVGLGPTFGIGKATLPPIGISGEFGINDEISLGGYLGFSTYQDKSEFFGISSKWNYTYIIVGARGSYHFAQSEKFDPYVGAFLGYAIGSSKWEGTGIQPTATTVGGFTWSGHLGARYRFNEKFGVFGELGYGLAILQLGLNLKF